MNSRVGRHYANGRFEGETRVVTETPVPASWVPFVPSVPLALEIQANPARIRPNPSWPIRPNPTKSNLRSDQIQANPGKSDQIKPLYFFTRMAQGFRRCIHHAQPPRLESCHPSSDLSTIALATVEALAKEDPRHPWSTPQMSKSRHPAPTFPLPLPPRSLRWAPR